MSTLSSYIIYKYFLLISVFSAFAGFFFFAVKIFCFLPFCLFIFAFVFCYLGPSGNHFLDQCHEDFPDVFCSMFVVSILTCLSFAQFEFIFLSTSVSEYSIVPVSSTEDLILSPLWFMTPLMKLNCLLKCTYFWTYCMVQKIL